MSSSALMVAALIAVLTMLAPLAQASPPDPLWTGGVFDANDLDDVVVVAASADGVTVPDARDAMKALWIVLGAVPPPGPVAALPSIHLSFQGRAPPVG
jgi:hypothetical protein